MPNVTPNSPDEFAAFDSDFEHVRRHRALEAAIESVDVAVTSSTGTFTTVTVSGQLTSNSSSTQALTATRVGLGGAVPGTASTAAPITGFYRTAGTVAVGIPSMSTASVTATIVSVETQTGNPVQPGVPIIASPQAALPAGVYMSNAYCLDTNSVTFVFVSRSGINATATVAYHVFSVDTIA